MSRLFLIYVVVELAVVVALASTIGLGWTLLVLLGTFLVGIAVAGSRIKRQVIEVLAGRSPVTDTAVTAIGAVLLVVPGLVSSAMGLLLLLPPTRTAARPVVAAIAARGLGWPLVAATWFAGRRRTRDVIDGEVTDVTDATDPEPPALP
ncbi:FxsA family protein [Mycobacterium shimoidei]|uniref:FxsA family protein n=1 Tax=Mycobacterium shimoidei TaxID=29313 RepID=UPI0035578297